MTDKPKASISLGLELTQNELKAASLSYKNRQFQIDRLFAIAIDPVLSNQSNVKPLYTEKEEKTLHTIANDSLVVTGLSTKDSLVRQLTVLLKKESDIDAVIDFQAEPLLPYNIEDALVDRIILEAGHDNTKLTIVAAKVEQLSILLDQWHSISIEPEVVCSVPVALAAFSEVFHKSETPFIHIHIGNNETTGILMSNSRLAAAQSIRTGIDEWIERVKEDASCSPSEAYEKIKEIDFSNISTQKYPSLSKHIAQYRLEITRLVYALRKQPQGQNAADILITGEILNLTGASQSICSGFQNNIITPELATKLSQPLDKILRYAIPIGMALTALPSVTNQINFRQKALSYPNPWKRIKKPIATYIAASLGLTLSIYFFGNAYIASQEDTLRKNYLELLTLMKKPYNEFEQEIKSKGPTEESHQIAKELSVMTLSQNDIQNRLQQLEQEIKATPDMFPLFPNVPRVSDVLAWLSTLPIVTGEEGGKNEKSPRIQLESFSYKIVKKPELSRKMEKYQVKVEIEFSTPTPRFAREFHDFLLAPNAIIDPKGDVKWNSERGKYRASFFLKDKTQYPNSR